MKEGILEVLLVNAEGIRHSHILGTPSYYVVVQCGTQEHRSKTSKVKDKKVWWNEKFAFHFPLSEWKNFTHIKFRMLTRGLFADGGFGGETIYYLGGLITEGNERGLIEVKPASYNVLLEDDTYKGQIMIGFKFIVNKEVHIERREFVAEENSPRQSFCSCIVNLWKMSRFRLLFRVTKMNSGNKQKEN